MLTNPAVGPDVSPEAVLRTLSGLQVVQGGCESVGPGKRSATGEIYPTQQKTPHLSGRGSCLKRKKLKGPVFRLSLSFYLMPGSSLLSHGETPHYHRRYGVSLLSSAWGQVGPPR